MKNLDWTIIHKSLSGPLTEQEQQSLSAWLAESEEHRRLYQKVKSYDTYSLSEEKYEEWVSEYRTVLACLKHRRHQHFIRRRILISSSVAAVFALIISLTLFLNGPESTGITAGEGHAKVQLQLADGQWLDLGAAGAGKLTEAVPAEVSSADKMLTYRPAGDSARMEYNILRTERGGEWNVVLEDGTRVYLNAASTLKYPVSFTGDSRQVELEGEAYFEVTPNPERPFIVRTADMDILVRGTSFNIDAYPERKTSRTTLVTGKVEVACAGQTLTIFPGQQIVFDKATQSAEIRDIDTELYTSWKEGFYKFQETRLEDILTDLSLWYDVDVIYADEAVKELRFTSSGKMARYDNLMSLLKKFEYMHQVTFELEGKNLIVRQK